MYKRQGYTYARYAREGFFQLLFVCILNVIIVLLGSGSVSYTHLDVYKRQVMHKGRICERGTHRELLEQDGIYLSLIHI